MLITFLNALAAFANAKYPFPLANGVLEHALWVIFNQILLLPAQSIKIVTEACFLTLSITAYSQLFRRPLQCCNMKLKCCSLVCLLENCGEVQGSQQSSLNQLLLSL